MSEGLSVDVEDRPQPRVRTKLVRGTIEILPTDSPEIVEHKFRHLRFLMDKEMLK